jgi:hypothetical protein
LVALAGGVAFVLAAVAVERYATNPEAFRSAKMRAAQVVERSAMRCARAAADLAARAELVYREGCAG